MKPEQVRFSRAAPVMALLAAALLTGCGVDQAPVAQDQTPLAPPSGGKTYLVFAPAGGGPAARVASVDYDDLINPEQLDLFAADNSELLARVKTRLADARESGDQPLIDRLRTMRTAFRSVRDGIGEITDQVPPDYEGAFDQMKGAKPEFRKARDDGIINNPYHNRLVDAFEALRRTSKRREALIVSPEMENLEAIRLTERNGDGPEDDITVRLAVPVGSVESEVMITMSLYGNSLSGLVAVFEPAGLSFVKKPKLAFWLGRAVVDIPQDEILAYHVFGDGETQPMEIIAIEENEIEIGFILRISGFSRYGLCGDNYTPDCGF